MDLRNQYGYLYIEFNRPIKSPYNTYVRNDHNLNQQKNVLKCSKIVKLKFWTPYLVFQTESFWLFLSLARYVEEVLGLYRRAAGHPLWTQQHLHRGEHCRGQWESGQLRPGTTCALSSSFMSPSYMDKLHNFGARERMTLQWKYVFIALLCVFVSHWGCVGAS